MPRYIDVDNLNLKGIAVFDENLDLLIPLSDVRKAILMIPAADVAPRAEVARAILKDVDNLLWRHKMRGIINLDLIHEDLVKLKKKYTEDKTDD